MNKTKLRKLFPVLKTLNNLKQNDLNMILPHLDNDVHHALTACICNGLRNEKVKSKRGKFLKKKLIKHKTTLRYLSNPKNSISQKKKKITQIGGSLGLILGTVLPILANFLFRKKK